MKINKTVLLLACVLCATSCGRKQKNPTPSTSNNSNISTGSIVNIDDDLEGTIVLGVPIGGDEQTELQAVIDAYMEIHPKVQIKYKFVETTGYKSYLETPLSAGDLSSCPFDICQNNLAKKYIDAGKFADFSPFLTEENPYYPEYDTWMDSMEPDAYVQDGSKGEIFTLNWQSTTVRFAYNKKMFAEVGVTAEDCATWDGFVEVCKKLNNAGHTPLAIGGNEYSFTSSQMGWLMNVYTDQYFRSSINIAHAQPGDYNYDPSIDDAWEYCPIPNITEDMTEQQIEEAWQKCYYNDYRENCTKNELRILKAIKDGQLGPIDKKYQNMLANLAEVFPKYCVSNYSSYGNDNMNSTFTKQETAMTLQQSYYVYKNWLNIKENYTPDDPKYFEIGFFDFPAMSANTKYPELADYGPDVDYTRSYGGSMGSWSIVNKNADQVRVCMDFMMFLTSPQAQEIYFDMARALDACVLKGTMIKGVDIPEDLLKGFELPKLKGSCSYNPAMTFSIGLGGESYSQSIFGQAASELFTTTPDYEAITGFAATMQYALQSNMFRYLRDRKYNSDCLDDVSAKPYI